MAAVQPYIRSAYRNSAGIIELRFRDGNVNVILEGGTKIWKLDPGANEIMKKKHDFQCMEFANRRPIIVIEKYFLFACITD